HTRSCALMTFKFWRRGESEIDGALKTRNLLILPVTQNAENGEIALNWNVSGTRDFSFAKRNFGTASRLSPKLATTSPSVQSAEPDQRAKRRQTRPSLEPGTRHHARS